MHIMACVGIASRPRGLKVSSVVKNSFSILTNLFVLIIRLETLTAHLTLVDISGSQRFEIIKRSVYFRKSLRLQQSSYKSV